MNVRDNLEAGVYENTLPYPNMATHNCKEKVRVARDEYRAEERRMNELLRADLEEEHGVKAALATLRVSQEKADKLWSLAWSHGHASGYNEVVNFYEEFVELVL